LEKIATIADLYTTIQLPQFSKSLFVFAADIYKFLTERSYFFENNFEEFFHHLKWLVLPRQRVPAGAKSRLRRKVKQQRKLRLLRPKILANRTLTRRPRTRPHPDRPGS
jgi:hypothetical protein